MKVLAIIPARYESSRFPGKPLALILGKTLIQRTYENALKCKSLDDLVVATDDERIYNHVKSFYGSVVMTSKNCLTGSDRLAEVVKNYEKYAAYEIIVNVQGDEPCLDPQVLSQLADSLAQDQEAAVATPITYLDPKDAFETSVVKCVIDLQGYALYFSRSLIPGGKSGKFQPGVTYYKHVGLYAYRKEFLLKYDTLTPTPLQIAEDLEQLKFLQHGIPIKTTIVNTSTIEVNLPEDIQKVEQFIWQQNTSL